MKELPLNQILHGDCINLLVEFPEKSIDLILTDPPYNIGTKEKITQVKGKPVTNDMAWGNAFNDNLTEEEYADFMLNLSLVFDRVLSNEGSILIFFDRGRPYYLKPFYDRFHFRNMIVFVKKNPAPHYRKNNYRSTFEQCAWFSREKYNINFLSQRKMKNVVSGLTGNLLGNSFDINTNAKQTDHPTEKYEWMIYPLIERHSNPRDTILDPMCGSGTTLSCAKRLNRNYIGIDLEEKWVSTSVLRMGKFPASLSDFPSINKQTKRTLQQP